MPRVLLTIVLPLLLPTAVYLLWVTALRPARRNGAPLWRALPWVWLAGVGVALLALVLFVAMSMIAPRSNDPVTVMRLIGQVCGAIGGVSVAMIILGLIGKKRA